MLRESSLLPDVETGDPYQQFQLLDTLGQGAYGQVSKALHKRTGNLYAAKILTATSHTEIAAIKKEIQILKLCDNQHIVKYYGSYFKDNNLWIILEYCHAGSIIDLINITQRKLNQNQIASILESVIQGLDYLHTNKKIHRDIKAANILLNNEGVAKLADFGVSAQSMYTNAAHRSQVGSPYWMSPEVMRHNQYTFKTDIWSLGVTAIEMAQGVVPNCHLKPLIALFQLRDKPIQGFKEPQKWSPEFNSFVKECLNTNPTLRPQAKTLLKHEFIVKNSRGQRLLAQLVQNSLSDIEQFRKGQEDSDGSQNDIINMLNASGFGTKTIVNNRTQRSQQSHVNYEKEMLRQLGGGQEGGNSSMVINDNEGSMIINNSMIVGEEKEKEKQKPSAFLSKYISGLKNTECEVTSQKQLMKKKITDYDETCLAEIEEVFAKYRGIINELLVSNLGEQFFGMDTNFIKEEINSKLHKSQNVKSFLQQFPKYEQKKKEVVKEFQRSDLTKKKSEFSQMAHHSTQTNDPGYTDLTQFKEIYSRGVKSQEFPEKQFKTNEKHCFNSKSIISDMENVKYSKDYPGEEIRFGKIDRSNKRFIVTEPYEWTSADSRPFMNKEICSSTDKVNLKEMFLSDNTLVSSIMKCAQGGAKPEKYFEPNTVKHDRVAESTLYHDCQDETFKHQNSVTVIRGREFKNNYSEQQYLILNEEFEGDDNDVNVNLFEPKASTGKSSKNAEPKKKTKVQKRVGSSEKRVGVGKSSTNLRKAK